MGAGLWDIKDRSNGVSEVEAFAWDMQTNTRMIRSPAHSAQDSAPTKRLQSSVERITFHSEESGFCVLRVTGVSFENRQDLLGHKSGRITTHYSAAELINLIEAANKVCRRDSRKSPAVE